MKFDFDRYGSAFLDAKLHRLRVAITAQLDSLFDRAGVEIPASCISVVLFLTQSGPASIAEIAEATDYSHQLVSQRLRRLEKLQLVERTRQELDRRKLLVGLTPRGKALAPKVEEILAKVAEALDKVFAEIDCDLDSAVQETLERLAQNPLPDRLETRMARVFEH